MYTYFLLHQTSLLLYPHTYSTDISFEAATAAWAENQWDDFNKYIDYVQQSTSIADVRAIQKETLRAVQAIKSDKLDDAEMLAARGVAKLATSRHLMSGESFRSVQELTQQAQILVEVQEVVQALRL